MAKAKEIDEKSGSIADELRKMNAILEKLVDIYIEKQKQA